MQKSEKFFIFTWKELTVIALLATISMGFFFTLGLHYGKKLPMAGGTATEEAHEPAGKLEAGTEVLPPREALEQGAQHSGGATDETLKDATKEELKQAKVKMESPKQVDLPTQSRSETEVESTGGNFAIQLGSYATKKEAQAKVKLFLQKTLHTEVRTAQVNGQTRFRVVIPGFAKRTLADQRGKELHSKLKIENFIVIKSE